MKKSGIFCVSVLLLSMFLLGPAIFGGIAVESLEESRAFLLEGVEFIGTTGSPGNLVAFGPQAAPLVLGRNGNARIAVVAIAQYEKGRVLALGHSGMVAKEYLSQNESTKRFAENAIRWLGSTQETRPRKTENLRLAVIRQRDAVDFFSALGAKVEFFNDFSEQIGNDRFDLICVNSEVLRDENLAKIDAFVRNGGGLLCSATGWGWAQLNPGQSLRDDFAGNKLLGPMGLVWGGDFASTTRREGGYTVSLDIDPYTHPLCAMDALFEPGKSAPLDKNQIYQATRSIECVMQDVPEQYVASTFERLKELIDRRIVPTKQSPVSLDKTPLDRLAVSLQIREYLHAQKLVDKSPQDNPLAKAAEDFPGAVPQNAARKSATVQIETAVPEWNSTGFYAPPGETITITIQEDLLQAAKENTRSGRRDQLSVRIGVHSDRLWHKEQWDRFPEISLVVPLKEKTTRLNNPFGGLVYLVFPRGLRGTVGIELDGVVEAPWFVQGKTSPEQWKKARENPAPWAELGSDRIVLTIPSKVVRDLEDPGALLDFWNAMLDCDADLVGRPPQRDRPERITVDRQISAGYMHSGYPVMCHLDVERKVVDLAALKKDGDWGFFHEFGHNHQNGDWTFEGAGEVTVNLFTLYNYEKLCGTPMEKTRRDLDKATRERRKAEHLEAGAPFERWKNDPFLALIMYTELIEQFGWDTFKTVFREYRDLSQAERPRNDAEKRDQWMVRFSRNTGKNLGPFFQQWGVPTTEKARDSIRDLPEWLP